MVPIGTLIKMRRNGFTYQQMADETGLPYTTISSRMRRLGIKPDMPITSNRRRHLVKHGNIDPELLKKLYWSDNKSLAAIAKEINVPIGSMRRLFEFHNIPTRTRGEGRRLFVANADPDSFYKPDPEQARLNGIKSGVVRRKRKEQRERARQQKQQKRDAARVSEEAA